MRTNISIICLLGVLLGSSEGASLRRAKGGGLEIKIDLTEHRELQTNTTVPGLLQDDGSDASIINQIIATFMPYFNQAFQAIVPDPIDLPFVGRYQLPEFDIFPGCSATGAFDLELGEVIGLSKMSIDQLLIQPGTEEVDANCIETFFNAVFDMTISSTSMFSVRGLEGGLTAGACGINLRDSVTGGVNTLRPTMRGHVSISGLLENTLATIIFADTAEILEVGYDRVEGYLDGKLSVMFSIVSSFAKS